ncbi:hypothetical protein [Phytomonospora endophytica]|uniref:Uncharacterized protein n=1 Tax=Phytomonospora endophytica TaxID=714109 RepID=A0A841FJ16_9ACTN|nr:hypothetical protein [Phytomonospora endophytica]MBB6037321.1 hypothetical protein [Phytomonospora endophytica]GIG69935.1 hypothetical protein Pen01_62300 [Phytomonospora endophytica]
MRKRSGRLAVVVLGAGLAILVGAGSAAAGVTGVEHEVKGMLTLSTDQQDGTAEDAGGVPLVGGLISSMPFGSPQRSTEANVPITGLSLSGESETFGTVTLELVGEAAASLDAGVGVPPALTGNLELTVKITVEKPTPGLEAEQEYTGVLKAEGITSLDDFLGQPWEGALNPVTDNGGASGPGEAGTMFCIVEMAAMGLCKAGTSA